MRSAVRPTEMISDSQKMFLDRVKKTIVFFPQDFFSWNKIFFSYK